MMKRGEGTVSYNLRAAIRTNIEAAIAEERQRAEKAEAQVAELRGLLGELQWSNIDDTHACPICDGEHPAHTPDCRLAAALKATEPKA
ncbi:MAG TPA: hypothetical protein VM120_25175 [Bryobacteraceae bacterium]|nr:hypothetical protein [Bryobacteraceae bacterium]